MEVFATQKNTFQSDFVRDLLSLIVIMTLYIFPNYKENWMQDGS